MSATQPIDVRDMAIIHQTFRNGFSESAQLVRTNPTPSAQRVQFLSDHIAFTIDMLHHHHAGEDELLFGRLLDRVPDQADVVRDVNHEHELVSGAIEAVTSARSNWAEQPSQESGGALADSLENLNAVLQPHLDHEEQQIVPLAAVNLTEAEWDQLGEEGRKSIPRKMMPVAFGMILEPLNEAERAYMKRHLPAPIRLLYGPMIQRPWDKYRTTLRSGT
jgi:hemerythrin-like domain-containing protein